MKNRLIFGASFLVVGLILGFFLSRTISTTGDPVKSYTGYLVCQSCAGSVHTMAADGTNLSLHPEKHTTSCLRMYTCVTSGFGIYVKNSSGNYTYYKFDKKGSDLAYKNIVATTKRPDNLSVNVTGKMKNDQITVYSITEK